MGWMGKVEGEGKGKEVVEFKSTGSRWLKSVFWLYTYPMVLGWWAHLMTENTIQEIYIYEYQYKNKIMI